MYFIEKNEIPNQTLMCWRWTTWDSEAVRTDEQRSVWTRLTARDFGFAADAAAVAADDGDSCARGVAERDSNPADRYLASLRPWKMAGKRIGSASSSTRSRNWSRVGPEAAGGRTVDRRADGKETACDTQHMHRSTHTHITWDTRMDGCVCVGGKCWMRMNMDDDYEDDVNGYK